MPSSTVCRRHGIDSRDLSCCSFVIESDTAGEVNRWGLGSVVTSSLSVPEFNLLGLLRNFEHWIRCALPSRKSTPPRRAPTSSPYCPWMRFLLPCSRVWNSLSQSSQRLCREVYPVHTVKFRRDSPENSHHFHISPTPLRYSHFFLRSASASSSNRPRRCVPSDSSPPFRRSRSLSSGSSLPNSREYHTRVYRRSEMD